MFTPLSKKLLVLGGVVLVGVGGGVTGYKYAQSKPATTVYVRELVTPTLVPTASPSATLVPTSKYRVIVPVVKPTVAAR